MDQRDLEALLADIESDTVERKESGADRGAIRKTVCAFANDLAGRGRPGILFIGARNDGSPSNLQVTDELLRNLADLRTQANILPPPSIDVQKCRLLGADMMVVAVRPSVSHPVRLDGRCRVRVGPSNRLATPEDERRLVEKRHAIDLPFDAQSLEGARLEDLDVGFFTDGYLPMAVAADVLEENRRTREEQLRSLRMLDAAGVPTVLGMLVLGQDPPTFLPGPTSSSFASMGGIWVIRSRISSS